MHELLLPPGIKWLKDVLETFKEQSHEIRNVLPAVLKISEKSLENHL